MKASLERQRGIAGPPRCWRVRPPAAAAQTLTYAHEPGHPQHQPRRQPRRQHRRGDAAHGRRPGRLRRQGHGRRRCWRAACRSSDDGKTYTFKLRKGVKFHNGAEMTSADVVWSWNRYMDPKTQWRCTSEFDGRGLVKVEKVEAPDAETFVITLDKPNALFLATLARTDCGSTAILHKDSVAPDGAWIKPVGTGPFKLEEWKRGECVTLSRFAAYASLPGAARRLRSAASGRWCRRCASCRARRGDRQGRPAVRRDRRRRCRCLAGRRS